MMSLYEAIMNRRSVRKFKDKPVSLDLLSYAVTLAKRGPSAGGIRGYELVVTDKVSFYDAPISVVICVDQEKYVPKYGDRGRNLYAIQDAAIAGAYLGLVLVAIGLSSCWVGAFSERKVREAISLDWRPVAVLAVGYAA